MHLLKQRGKGFLIALMVILLNLLLVTQVVGLSYDKFNWRHYFSPVQQGDDDPYDDDDDDDDNSDDPYDDDDDEPYAPYEQPEEPYVVPTEEPYVVVTEEPYVVPTEEPYVIPTEEPYVDVTPPPALPTPIVVYQQVDFPTVVYEQVDAPPAAETAESPQATAESPEPYVYEDLAPPAETGLLGGEGFLGTNASFRVDLTLVLELLLWVGLIVGIVVQRQNKWKYHDWIATSVVVANLFLIGFVMVGTFRGISGGIPNDLGQPFVLFPTVHAVLGTIGEVIGLYCLLAGHQILPRRIGALRYWMWTAFGFWTAAMVLGVATYVVFYVPTGEATEQVAEETGITETAVPTDTAQPLPTEPPAPEPLRVLLQNFQFNPGDITIVSGTTVTWLNQDKAPHNVNFQDIASSDMLQGGTFEYTFDRTGQFVVYCNLHGSAGSGMSTTVNVVENTPENVAQIEATVAAAPTPDTQPDVAAAPALPPPPIALLEPPAPEQTLVGIVAFFDSFAPSDSASIIMTNMQQPAAGQQYYAWLTDSRTNQVQNLGPVQPDANGQLAYNYIGFGGQNLMAAYDGFLVTSEQAGAEVLTPGATAYSGQQPPAAFGALSTLVVAASDTPGNTGYAVGARSQAFEAVYHIGAIQEAYDFLSIGDAKRHAEHVINAIDGVPGQDIDGVHGAQNPGDGYGVIGYLNAMKAAAQAAADAPDASNAVKVHAGHVIMSVDNALVWAETMRTAVLDLNAQQSIGDIGPQLETLTTYGQLLISGSDNNGDGQISPEEGGVLTAYQHAQYMGALAVATGENVSLSNPQPVNVQIGEVVDGKVVVEMQDFAYFPPAVSIPVGTTVLFVNTGQALHSATSDTLVFDSTLIGAGQSFSFTFAEPGVFPFYCDLHGLPGGAGMAGVIEVEAP